MGWNRQDWQMIQSGFDRLGPAIQQMQRDKLYNNMLDELYPPRAGTADGSVPGERPHRGGMIEYELMRDKERRELDRAIAEARIQGAESRRSRSTPYVDTPYGPMTPKQWAAEERLRSRPTRQSSTPEEKALRSMTNKLNEDVIAETGLTLDDIPKVRNQRLVNPDGTPFDNSDPLAVGEPIFAGEVPMPDGTVRAFQLPKKKADELINRFDGARRYRESIGLPPVSVNGESVDAPVRVNSKEERDALPAGTRYIAPDGSIKIKR
jgi:hypothetical protein